MEGTELAAIASAVVSLLLQVVKASLPEKAQGHLRLVAALLGALAGGSAGYIGGGQTVAEIGGNAALSALLTGGVHAVLLQNSWLGNLLKNLLGAKP